MEFKINAQHESNGPPVLVLMGVFDAHAASELDQAMIKLTEQGYGSIILDVSGMQSVDEAFYAVLLEGQKRCRKRGGGGLGIACPIQSLYDEFENRGLNKIFPIREKRDDVSRLLEPPT